jgi:hypothetical protein
MERRPSSQSHQLNLASLQQHIKRTEASLISNAGTRDNAEEMAVLFTGNWHDSIPRALILAPGMTPTEKLIWQVIRTTIGDASRPGSMPRRSELADLAGCSLTTITTSREVLRINRWMTHCKTVRHKGRFVGDIYLLNDEPLSLATTLELDPSYIEFLERLVNGASKTNRVKQMAATVLQEIDSLNKPITQPTEVDVITLRFKRMGIFVTPEERQEQQGRNQEQNLTLVAGAPGPIPGVMDPGRVAKHGKGVGKIHQDKILTSARTAGKNHQDQNLTLAQSPVEPLQQQAGIGDFLANFNQGENLTPVIGGESDQDQFLTPVVTSSFCSSSLLVNINKNKNAHAGTHARTRVDEARRFEPAGGKDDDGDDDESLDEVYPLWPELGELKTLIVRYLPEISNPVLEFYCRALLLKRKAQIPQLARSLKQVKSKALRQNILYQLLGKAAADWHGWSAKPLGNMIGYVNSLIRAAQEDQLRLDENAFEFMSAVEQKRKPVFPTTPERLEDWKACGISDWGDGRSGDVVAEIRAMRILTE